MAKIYKTSTKILLTYIVSCLIPILITTVHLTVNLVGFTKQNTILLSSTNTNQIQLSILNVLDDAHKILNNLVADQELTKYLTTDFNSDYDAFIGYTNLLERRIRTLISNQYQILIYTNNPSIGISRMTNNSMKDFYKCYGAEAEMDSSEIISMPVLSTYLSEQRIGFYKVLTDLNSTDNKIIYSVEVPVKTLLKARENSDTEVETIFLFDKSGTVLASTEASNVFHPIESLQIENVSNLRDLEAMDSLTMEGIKYYSLYANLQEKYRDSYSNIPEWHLLYLVPYRNLEEKLMQTVSSNLLLILAFIFMFFLLATSMSNRLTTRLTTIGQKMKEVVQGNFNVEAPIKIHDEIGALEENMYLMVERLDDMIQDIYTTNRKMTEQQINFQKMEQEKKEAQLIALRRQINPHYLFNTLESIRMHLIIKGDMETAKILRMFSSSYRNMLSSEYDFYTLNEELKFVSDYVSVQQYRFENKFTYEVSIPSELQSCLVPKLTLQPLVENALYHGIEDKRGLGHIWVAVVRTDDFIIITVEDDGVGISEQKLEELRDALKNQHAYPNSFLALQNIQERLRLISGENDCLQIESVFGQGTVVRLTLPYQIKEDPSC